MKNLIYAALAWAVCLSASADTESVTVSTRAAEGTQLTFLVNNSRTGVTMDWGNGTPVAYTKATDGIIEVTGKVAGATLTLSSERPITMFAADGCELTAVTLTKATSLRSLYLQNNALTTIDVSKLPALRDLNVAHNELTRLTLSTTAQPLLETLDLSSNAISATSFSYGTENLQYLCLAENNYKTLTLTKVPHLSGLVAQGNQVTALNLSATPDITLVSASDNNIATLTLPETLPELTQMFLADNELSGTITLSSNKKLNTLDVARNNLSNVALPSAKLYAYDCSENALAFNSFPRTTYTPLVYANLQPQEPFNIGTLTGMNEGSWGTEYQPWATMAPAWADRSNTKYIVDMTALRSGATSTSVKIGFVEVKEDGTEETLTQTVTSSDPLQFANTTGKVVFFRPAAKMYGVLTDAGYPDITLRTTSFAVLDPTAEGIATTVKEENSSLVYDLQGRVLKAPLKGQGGLVISNNKKVLIK